LLTPLTRFFVHTIEDLIDFSLTKIEQPLNLIPKTPTGNYSEPGDFEFEEDESNLDRSSFESQDMGDNNDNNGEMGDRPRYIQRWLSRDALEIPGQVHNLPRHPEKLLPKFDLETSKLPEDHIKNFILAIRLMNVQHEDVVCRLFPYTFENSGST
jgi:hypothetical protein